jgi:hypothetical protein
VRASFVIIIQNSSSLSKKRQIRSCSGQAQASDSAFFMFRRVPSSKKHRVGEERLTGMSHGSTAGAASDSCAVTISIRIKKKIDSSCGAGSDKREAAARWSLLVSLLYRAIGSYYNT